MNRPARAHLIAVLGLCALLAACRSAPVHYHTLTPLLGGQAEGSPPATHVIIERLTVPPQVDRTQIVLRQGDNGLVILETDWWGASLADELQSALENQLDLRPIKGDRASLRIDVQRFDLVPGRYALLDVKWRLRTATATDAQHSEVSCQYIVRGPAGETVDDLVKAQQVNVQKMAEQISASSTGRCP